MLNLLDLLSPNTYANIVIGIMGSVFVYAIIKIVIQERRNRRNDRLNKLFYAYEEEEIN